MKCLIYSDLHINFRQNYHFMKNDFEWPFSDEYDVIIAAGDIGEGVGGIQWLLDNCPSNKPVIYLPGNHEYYHQNFQKNREAITELSKDTNIHFLDPGSVTIDGVTFIGATLWSTANLLGYPDTSYNISRSINDFRLITYEDHIFTLDDMRKEHKKDSSFIEQELNKDYTKKIVVTHFPPSQECIDTKYANDPINPYFVNDLDDLVEKADLWIAGHTHSRMRFNHISGTEIVIQPLGYQNEHRGIYPPLIIDV